VRDGELCAPTFSLRTSHVLQELALAAAARIAADAAVDLRETCEQCGRKFAVDRLAKHTLVCTKVRVGSSSGGDSERFTQTQGPAAPSRRRLRLQSLGRRSRVAQRRAWRGLTSPSFSIQKPRLLLLLPPQQRRHGGVRSTSSS
jgi:hypothetical protein